MTTEPLPTEPDRKTADKKWDYMHIENQSCCLLAAVTIVEIVTNEKAQMLESMDLVWGDWLEPGEIREVPLQLGHHYGILIEAFYWDEDTKKATAKAGEEFRDGVFIGGKTAVIEVVCPHIAPEQEI